MTITEQFAAAHSTASAVHGTGQAMTSNSWPESRYADGLDDARCRGTDPLLAWVERYFDCDAASCQRLNRDYVLRKDLSERTEALALAAYADNDRAALESATAILETIYRHDFNLRGVALADSEVAPIARDLAAILEEHYLASYLDGGHAAQIAAPPRGGKEFVRWFKDAVQRHVSSNHPFYEQFLPDTANREQLRFYLAQETNLDPKFDDILAQIQIGHRGAPKMEIASNYWDEMGNGQSSAVHTALFQQTLDYLGIDDDYLAQRVFYQSVASGNMSSCLALHRRHNLRALGYFGTTEYIAPKRFKSLLKAWQRLDLDPRFAEYHRLHVTIDAVHGNAWLNNVIAPLVEQDPTAGVQIAQGMLLRLASSNDYLDALLQRVAGQ
jgi:pyrroloquinoline quinone (PQQ) biosynthesis protein C